MAAEARDPLLQLIDPAQRADPYPLYRQILERGPYRLPDNNLCVFGSFADCEAILRHPSSCSDRLKWTAIQRAMAAGQTIRPFGAPGFIFLDEPDHMRLRKLVSKAFTAHVIQALEPEIIRLIDDCLSKVESSGTFDIVQGLAHPLPVRVICRLLGIPIEDEPQLSESSSLLSQGLDPFVLLTGETQGADQRVQAGLHLRQYLRELLEQRRARPSEDLISALIAAEESGDTLSDDEIVATCNLLFLAGHETTVNLITNAALAMLRQTQYWRELSINPSCVSAITEESLRYDPPSQIVTRIAGENMIINDLEVPKGDMMILALAAAHRDPEANENPDTFIPFRPIIRHLAFAFGPHFCLGAPLARLESALTLTALTNRFPNAQLCSEPTYKPHVTLRGLAKLEISV